MKLNIHFLTTLENRDRCASFSIHFLSLAAHTHIYIFIRVCMIPLPFFSVNLSYNVRSLTSYIFVNYVSVNIRGVYHARCLLINCSLCCHMYSFLFVLMSVFIFPIENEIDVKHKVQNLIFIT